MLSLKEKAPQNKSGAFLKSVILSHKQKADRGLVHLLRKRFSTALSFVCSPSSHQSHKVLNAIKRPKPIRHYSFPKQSISDVRNLSYYALSQLSSTFTRQRISPSAHIGKALVLLKMISSYPITSTNISEFSLFLQKASHGLGSERDWKNLLPRAVPETASAKYPKAYIGITFMFQHIAMFK